MTAVGPRERLPRGGGGVRATYVGAREAADGVRWSANCAPVDPDVVDSASSLEPEACGVSLGGSGLLMSAGYGIWDERDPASLCATVYGSTVVFLSRPVEREGRRGSSGGVRGGSSIFLVEGGVSSA